MAGVTVDTETVTVEAKLVMVEEEDGAMAAADGEGEITAETTGETTMDITDLGDTDKEADQGQNEPDFNCFNSIT